MLAIFAPLGKLEISPSVGLEFVPEANSDVLRGHPAAEGSGRKGLRRLGERGHVSRLSGRAPRYLGDSVSLFSSCTIPFR